jgi:hypothetical protein
MIRMHPREVERGGRVSLVHPALADNGAVARVHIEIRRCERACARQRHEGPCQGDARSEQTAQAEAHDEIDRRQRRGEDGVVDAAEDLDRNGQPDHQRIAPPPALYHAFEREQDPRQRERRLQLEVLVVVEAIWRECERHRGDDRGQPAAGQPPREQPRADAREHHAAEEQRVVDHDERRAHPDERRRDQRGQQHGVGVGERARFRKEDRRVEEMGRVRRQRVRDPAQTPHAEQRILVPGDTRRKRGDLRPCHHGSDEEEQHGDRRDLRERRLERPTLRLYCRLPPIQTLSIRRVLRMSSSGFADSTTRSAIAPAWIAPSSPLR